MNSKCKQLRMVDETQVITGNSQDQKRDLVRDILKETDQLFPTSRQRARPMPAPATPLECTLLLRNASPQVDELGHGSLEITAARLMKSRSRMSEDWIAGTTPTTNLEFRNPYNLLSALPNTDKRIHMIDINKEVAAIVEGIRYFFGQLWTPAGFCSTHNGHRLIWALIEDYVNQQCVWNPEFNDGCNNLIASTPRFVAELKEFMPPNHLKLPAGEGQLNFEGVLDGFNYKVFDPVRDSIHKKVSALLCGPTWMIWGVIPITTMIAGRPSGNVPVLMSGIDFRIMDYDRRMRSGEWVL